MLRSGPLVSCTALSTMESELYLVDSRASLVAQRLKDLPAMWETWVQSRGWEDSLEKGKATHISILAWRILWTMQSMGLQRVRRDFHFHYHYSHFLHKIIFSESC